MRRALPLLFLLTFGIQAYADISMPAIFSSGMVLQQNTEVTFWGWGKPFEKVSISPSWDPDTTYSLTISNQSRWELDIPTPEAGGPYEIVIQGINKIVIDDVLIGENWLGSGQSNMEWSANLGIENGEEESEKADFPEIRLFTVSTATADDPQQLLNGKWVKCSPEIMKSFSAVLYFFGRELHQKLNVPIGLINSSWGGTPAEVWIKKELVSEDAILGPNSRILEEVPWAPVRPGKAFNAMINPIIPFKINGVIWYQGETNVTNPYYYAQTMETLISSWRANWKDDFSFYFAQIAPFRGYGTDHVRGAVLRDQQRKTLNLVHKSGMVVTSDIGNLDDIHPRNKLDVGKRFANLALKKDYEIGDKVVEGPHYENHISSKGKIIVTFKNAGEGLEIDGSELIEFELKGDDGSWEKASAEITSRNKVTVESESVKNPSQVRFGFRNASNPNLFNSEGLPASCFTTEL